MTPVHLMRSLPESWHWWILMITSLGGCLIGFPAWTMVWLSPMHESVLFVLMGCFMWLMTWLMAIAMIWSTVTTMRAMHAWWSYGFSRRMIQHLPVRSGLLAVGAWGLFWTIIRGSSEPWLSQTEQAIAAMTGALCIVGYVYAMDLFMGPASRASESWGQAPRS